jgi:AraC-like DNA-binding protein
VFAQEYLNLESTRLKFPEEWSQRQGGFSFLFPKGGGGTYVSGPVVQGLSPGDVLVLHGDKTGKVRAANGAALVFRSFSLCLEHLFPLFASNEISLLQDLAVGFKGMRFYPASSPLAAECHRLIREIGPQLNLDHRSRLVHIAAVLLTERFKTARGQRAGFVRIEDHMIQVFNALSAKDLLTLSVGELAKKFGCSRRHLGRLFHQYFGLSAAALRTELRLLKAVTLLRDPDAKIINVANECGFNHLRLFNTCFKRRFGETPSRWRKLTAQGEDIPLRRMDADGECPLRSTGLCPWVGEKDEGRPARAEEDWAQPAVPRRLLIRIKPLDLLSRELLAISRCAAGKRPGRSLGPAILK